MPTRDPQSSKLLPHKRKVVASSSPISPSQSTQAPRELDTIDTIRLYPNHSTLSTHSPITPRANLPMRPLASSPEAHQELEAQDGVHEHAIDFATHSWDLKTGGLKTLTAKRELPTRFDRRSVEATQAFREASTARNYMFITVVLVCVVFMLIGGGVILFVILQP